MTVSGNRKRAAAGKRKRAAAGKRIRTAAGKRIRTAAGKRAAAAVLALCLLAMTGCAGKNADAVDAGAASGTGSSVTVDLAGRGGSSSLITAASDLDYAGMFTKRDTNTSWSATSSTKIELEGGSILVTGSGAAANGDAVVISEAGTYHLTGTLTDGQVVVQAPGDAKVQLVLDNVDITCSSSACLLIESADKVFVTLAEGSENTLSDTGAAYVQADDSMNVDAVVFSRSDLVFNGSGSLAVNAGYQDGIVGKDDLKFTGGIFAVTAAGKGIVGKDSLRIRDGTFTVTAQDDALHTSNDEKAGKGYLYIEGGTFTLSSGDDAVHAATALVIRGGTLDIPECYEGLEGDTIDIEGGDIRLTASDDGLNAAMAAAAGEADASAQARQAGGAPGADAAAPSGTGGTPTPPDGNGFPSSDAAAPSGTGGMPAPPDGNGFPGADQAGAFGTDGMPAPPDFAGFPDPDAAMAAQNDAAAEGGTGPLQDSGGPQGRGQGFRRRGDLSENAGGDGTGDGEALGRGGAMGGGPMMGGGSGMGGGMMMDVQSDCYIHITGGTLYVNAQGDGIDSNGSIVIDGGDITVDGPTGDGNGALDCGTEAVVNGGTVAAAGSSGMAETFSENSAQHSILYNFSETLGGGTSVRLLDENGKEVCSLTPVKSYSSIVFSSPAIKDGTYTVQAGTQEEQIEVSGVSTSAGASSFGMGGGMRRGQW